MSGEKVMIIDDSKTICKSAELFLGNAGYKVICVENGFDALIKVMEERPDILFIDVMMPKLDGYQTCQIIKQNPEFSSLPIIILSSKDGVFDKARGKIVGSTEYLTKPFTKEGIVEVVKKYLNK